MRHSKFLELQDLINAKSIPLKLKYRNLKKDPLILAISQVPNGYFIFELVEDTKFPWGSFLVTNLNHVNTLPTGSKEPESVYTSFGFHETPELLLKQISSAIATIQQTLNSFG